MKTITLDFSGIKSYWELHEYLKEVFQLPEYYGHNMDALWDCLIYSFEFPTTIVLSNLSKISKALNEEVQIMLELFRDLETKDKKVTVIIDTESQFNNLDPFLI